jgi:hypothetical protein
MLGLAKKFSQVCSRWYKKILVSFQRILVTVGFFCQFQFAFDSDLLQSSFCSKEFHQIGSFLWTASSDETILLYRKSKKYMSHIIKWHLFRMTFVQNDICSKWDLFRMRFVQNEICSEWDLFRMRFVQNEICSEWHLFKNDICSKSDETMILYRKFGVITKIL